MARFRGEFTGWLDRHFSFGTEQRVDVVLAVNEELTNAVEFGCAYGMHRAQVLRAAVYDDHAATLTVTVNDAAGGGWALRPHPHLGIICSVDGAFR